MYNNLDHSKSEIRLLRLLPGHGSDVVHCELLTVSLDGPNEFEALSYVWGSKADPVQIVLSGQIKGVTGNLGSALRHLRNEEKERILWVDAVCINQDDLDERSSQVQLMQRIYSGASQVVVWLGPLKKDYEQIMEVIRTLGRDSTLHWTAIPTVDDGLFPLYGFLRHPWWSRIWTVQEAVLAKQLVYYCGKIHLLSHDVTGVAASYRAHFNTIQCCQNQLTEYYKGGLVVGPDMTSVTDNILQLRQFQLRTRDANFDEVASLFRHRQATNPRDKVYGLLGISRGIQESSIDYRFSEAKVYELATRDSMSHNRNLNILSHIIPRQLLSDRSVRWAENAPSWVPDWAAPDYKAGSDLELMRYRAPFLAYYNACRTLPYEPTKGDTAAGILRLSGVCCDAIATISESVHLRPFFSEEDTVRDWRDMAGLEKQPGKAYVAGDTVAEAFWRTLCLDIYTRAAVSEGEAMATGRAGAEERDAHLVYWYAQLSGRVRVKVGRAEVALMKRVSEFSKHVSKVVARRRFFISCKGYMGLGPLESEVGDRICVLAGGRAPFIVRAAQQKGDEASPRFVCRLLGDSYIHGLMDGEAMKLVDAGILHVEDFELV
ncbi:hypothetical protein ANO14919_131290 [Xylariales sp. No.14919]|nr:hypothetical protein ANO14919_131290 [Xylariales sp. No.14919]